MFQVRLMVLKLHLLTLLLPFLVRVFWSFFEDSLEKTLRKSPFYPLLLVAVTCISTLLFIGTSSYIFTLNTATYKEEQQRAFAQRKLRHDTITDMQTALLKFSQENTTKIPENKVGFYEFPLLFNDYKKWLSTHPASPQLLYNAAVLASWSGRFEEAQSFLDLAMKK